jgi:hypothetical protein
MRRRLGDERKKKRCCGDIFPGGARAERSWLRSCAETVTFEFISAGLFFGRETAAR